MTTWQEDTSYVDAFIRFAINFCRSVETARSVSVITYQEDFCFQAACVTAPPSEAGDVGSWVAARTCCSIRGSPSTKSARYPDAVTVRKPLLSCVSSEKSGVAGTEPSNEEVDSPTSGASAAR